MVILVLFDDLPEIPVSDSALIKSEYASAGYCEV